MPKPPFADPCVGSRRSAARCGKAPVVVAAVLAFLSAVVAAPPVDAQTPVTAGYRDFSFGSSAISTPTGEKPESKLWWNDGSWWGVLFNASANAYHIYRFNSSTQAWTDTGTAVDNRKNSKSDALWDEPTGRLYVVSHVFTTSGKTSTSSSQWGRLYRYTYDGASDRYTLDAGFPITVTRGIEETLTIAKDSLQRLWVTFVEAGKVKINWSRANDLDWGTPVDLPVSATAISVNSDDISSIVAFGGTHVGVMWSNQNRSETYFTYRNDTDAPETWQPIETVLPGQGCSGACADDHFNLKTDQSGRVFAATKTSLTSSTSPLAMLSVRSATTPATWVSYPIGLQRDHHTRPIVLLDEPGNRVYVFATSGESGGAIYMKSCPLDDIGFPSGLGQAFIKSSSDTTINNATSTKQNVNATTGLIVAASDQNTRFYLHGFLRLDGTADVPSAPTGLSAQAVSSTRVDLSWTDTSSNEDSFSVERSTGGGAFSVITTTAANATGYSDTTVAASTSYTYRVRAVNTGGSSAYSNTASVTTPGSVAVPAAPTGLAAQAVSSTRIDLTWTDASSNEDLFSIERATSGGAFGVIATVAANVTGFSDTTVSASTSYSYRVRAQNAGGFSAYSNTASVTTPAGTVTTPAPPTGLTAQALSSTRVDLAWTDASNNEDSFSIERATGAGSFGVIATTAANAVSFSDTTVSPSTSYSYRVRAQNTGGFSTYSNTATVTTPAGGGSTGSPIKSVTFEGGSLTDPTTGADKVAGTVSLETAAPLKGSYSARVPNVASTYLEENFTGTDDLYVAVYIRLNALPAADARILMVSNAGITVGNIVVRTTGRLRMRVDTTTVGVESAALQVGQIYRVGIHQKRGSGGNALLEAFVVPDGQAFGSPFASTTTGAWTTAADRVRAGATNPSAIDIAIDDLFLDASVMPGL